MKLAIMTRPTFFVEEDKILEALFDEGLDDLHIFKPNSSPLYVERLLSLLPESTHRRITVHHHFYLKEEFRLKGIHLNSCQAEIPQHYRGNVSRTCHCIDELKEAKKKSNYVFLKTMFDSQSNPADKSTLTAEMLREASKKKLIDKKVYALGGMNLDNISMAKDLGFGGVVICGDLWNRFDIHNELDYKALISHFEKLRKAVE